MINNIVEIFSKYGDVEEIITDLDLHLYAFMGYHMSVEFVNPITTLTFYYGVAQIIVSKEFKGNFTEEDANEIFIKLYEHALNKIKGNIKC